MNFEDENQNNGDINKNEEENGEKKLEERDPLTQNIDDEAKKISKNPNNIYNSNENFCDYQPKEE